MIADQNEWQSEWRTVSVQFDEKLKIFYTSYMIIQQHNMTYLLLKFEILTGDIKNMIINEDWEDIELTNNQSFWYA